MTIKVDLSPETEARLAAEARAQGLPLEKVAERLLNLALTGKNSLRGKLSIEEFHQMLESLSKDSNHLPDLPTESFSRESFYEDPLNGRDAVPRR